MNFEKYSKTFLHFHSDEIPTLINKYLGGNAKSVADLGAGDGSLLIGMKQKGLLKNVKNIVAVDLSKDRCNRLSQIDGLDVICADVTEVPQLESESFDFIICTQVIEHVDQEKLLREIKRLIKPDGKLYIASLIKKKYGFFYYKTLEGKWGMDPTHLREYASRSEYENVLIDGGFKIIETTTSALKLSLFEFIVRRIIVPIFKPKNANSFFLKYKLMNFLRVHINIHPPGYLIVESVVSPSEIIK